MSVTAIGKWTILPGNKEKVAAAINELCERVKNDPNESGTLIYHPHLVLSNELNNPIPAVARVTISVTFVLNYLW